MTSLRACLFSTRVGARAGGRGQDGQGPRAGPRARYSSRMETPRSDEAVEHTWQARVDAVWADTDASEADVLDRMTQLVDELPESDPRGPFELGGANDSAGNEAEAAALYERAIALGLSGESRAALDIQYASTLRNLGRIDEAISVLESTERCAELGAAPDAFLALALHSAGRESDALATAVEALIPFLPKYHRSLTGYAAELRSGEDRTRQRATDSDA